MVEYSAFKCDLDFFTFEWNYKFIQTFDKVCNMTTDLRRKLSGENSMSFIFFANLKLIDKAKLLKS